MNESSTKRESRTQFMNTRIVLAVVDLKRSTDFYVNQLGFANETGSVEGWSFLRRGEVRIFLGECPDEKPASEIGNHSYAAYFQVSGIVDLFQDYKDKGIEVTSELETKPWGMREFAIRTPDGHRFMFGQETGSG